MHKHTDVKRLETQRPSGHKRQISEPRVGVRQKNSAGMMRIISRIDYVYIPHKAASFNPRGIG